MLRIVEHAAGAEVSVDARSLDIAFQPGDELVQLQIIADMGAADDAVGGEVGAEAERKDGERVGAPGIADLAAEIEAGPGKEWNSRDGDRRRRLRSAAKAGAAAASAATGRRNLRIMVGSLSDVPISSETM